MSKNSEEEKKEKQTVNLQSEMNAIGATLNVQRTLYVRASIRRWSVSVNTITTTISRPTSAEVRLRTHFTYFIFHHHIVVAQSTQIANNENNS